MNRSKATLIDSINCYREVIPSRLLLLVYAKNKSFNSFLIVSNINLALCQYTDIYEQWCTFHNIVSLKNERSIYSYSILKPICMLYICVAISERSSSSTFEIRVGLQFREPGNARRILSGWNIGNRISCCLCLVFHHVGI